MVGLHTWTETISLEVNEGFGWRMDEIGRVRHIQKHKGGEMELDFAEDRKTMKVRASNMSCPGREVKL